MAKEKTMKQGVRVLVYPVKDMERAKRLFGEVIGTKPYADAPYYAGFRVGDLEIGLDPNSHSQGPIAYWEVPDIHASLQRLLDAGARADQAVKDVGRGMLIATVKDADGNTLGLRQSP